MATASEIAYVRQLINELDATNGWTDVRITDFIEKNRDATGFVNLKMAASDIWGAKATTFSQLVDVSESGSSRKMSDLLKNALLLQTSLRQAAVSPVAPVNPLAKRPKTRAIVRP